MDATKDCVPMDVADRMTVDLCRTGAPKPLDVLEWAVQRWPEFQVDEPVNGGDLVDWFGNEFLPVARAALAGGA